jgi:DnaK suppressor protein
MARFDASLLARILFLIGPNAASICSLTAHIRQTRISFMEKKKLEQFRKQLETRQQELRRTVTRTEEDGRIADAEAAQDIADRAANSYTKEFLFSQSNNDRQLLNMINGALERIREGSFGECISCGNEINPKRLEAVPWTRYCIACQERMEQGAMEESRM